MKKLTTSIVFCILVCISVWGRSQPNNNSTGTENTQPTEAATTSASHQLSAADIETSYDGVIPSQLAREDIAGATVAIVKDGKLLFAKGYGYADAAKRTPVSAEETLFRSGSVSKLFTWTAVMQLFERGKLDWNRDVNDYLDFRIPEAFGKPITIPASKFEQPAVRPGSNFGCSKSFSICSRKMFLAEATVSNDLAAKRE